jgi:hypothetical protein
VALHRINLRIRHTTKPSFGSLFQTAMQISRKQGVTFILAIIFCLQQPVAVKKGKRLPSLTAACCSKTGTLAYSMANKHKETQRG